MMKACGLYRIKRFAPFLLFDTCDLNWIHHQSLIHGSTNPHQFPRMASGVILLSKDRFVYIYFHDFAIVNPGIV